MISSNPEKFNISDYLKHKSPILLVDKIIEIIPGEYCQTHLNIKEDMWFFNCHYPDYPVMPGSLLIEAMSQAMTIAITSSKELKNSIDTTLIRSIESIKFYKEVLPNMELIFNASIISSKRGIIKGEIFCKNNNNLICDCSMTIVIPGTLGNLDSQIKNNLKDGNI